MSKVIKVKKVNKANSSNSFETKHVAFCINKNVLVDTVVCIESLLATNIGPFFIHVLYEGELDEEPLRETVENYNQKIEFHQIDPTQFEDLNSFQGNYATYFRFLIPKLINAKRLLYLDADIVVNGDISAFWETDMKGKGLIAIPNTGTHVSHAKSLGVEPRSYFNAGVLFFDIEYIRKHHIFEKTLAYLRKNLDTVLFHDQDGLNVSFVGNYFEFGREYNYASKFKPGFVKIKNPKIIHYYGTIKPKIWWSAHPLRHIWWRYLRQSVLADSYKSSMTLKTCWMWIIMRVWVFIQRLGLSGIVDSIRKKKLAGNR